MRSLPALLLLCLLAVPALATSQSKGRVISVADGDTITVLIAGKQPIKVRLYGIDAPERGQPYGARAQQALSDAVFGKNVIVDPMDTDSSGLTVAIVYMPDGSSLLEHMVSAGFAWVYPQLCKREDICGPLRRLEAGARGMKRGLWADKIQFPPWEWRQGKQCWVDSQVQGK